MYNNKNVVIGLYDIKDNEKCVLIADTYVEVAEWLGVSVNSIYSNISYQKAQGIEILTIKGYEIALVNISEV